MILLIDLYDSFTNNLAQLIAQTTKEEVIIVHNDTFLPEEYELFFSTILPNFQYVVVGPGPGHPSNAQDIGIVAELYRRGPKVPILGICLGFQSLCHEFGNPVNQLSDVRHGQIYNIRPLTESAIFLDISEFESVRYHSLYVDIDSLSPEIIPLAVCTDNNRPVLMAGRHRELPYFGVQYHPESVCSARGDELIRNFHKFASDYNKNISIQPNKPLIDELKRNKAVYERNLVDLSHPSINNLAKNSSCIPFTVNNDPIGVCDHFHNTKTPFFLLHSASSPGQWSIIGLPDQTSEIITHSVDSPSLYTVEIGHKTVTHNLQSGDSIWNIFGKRMEQKYIPRAQFNLDSDLPFLGGYLGLVSYEEGRHLLLDSLESFTKKDTPDFKLVYIDRFVIIDNVTKEWHIMSIRDVSKTENTDWCIEMKQNIINAPGIDMDTVPFSVQELAPTIPITCELPSKDIYSQQFDQCQKILHSGDSYELCLTATLKARVSAQIESWDIYKILALRRNPSPYSCFLEFDDVTLISSSPERFLSWKDDPVNEGDKLVELRPIKGTVKNTPEMTKEIATETLKTPKEMGENLMIVDLIRHDLHQFTPSVNVKQLMSVEEYKTVFQLVSVIQGNLTESSGKRYYGLDVLSDSLPPGSMTGAPKKRSVELLQTIEAQQKTSLKGGRRGIYSGVVGYWSVTDDSDWSVIIRSLFHYKNDKQNTTDSNIWRFGAGGAITVLSDKEGEWNEMYIKLDSTLQAFT